MGVVESRPTQPHSCSQNIGRRMTPIPTPPLLFGTMFLRPLTHWEGGGGGGGGGEGMQPIHAANTDSKTSQFAKHTQYQK